MLLREDSPLITTVRPQERLNLGHAAHLVRNTILGDATIEPYDSWYDPYADPNKKRFNKVSILCSRVETNCMWIQTLLIWSLIFLSYVEPPHWCRSIKVSEDTTNASMHEFGSCRILLSAKNEEYSYYPNFGWMFLTMDQSNFIQKIIVAILGFFLLLRFGRYGCELKRLFFPGAIRIINFSRCFLLMILLSNYAPVYEPFFRFLLFGSYLKKSQKEIIAITKMLPEIFYILAMLGVAVAFYSFAGVILFNQTPQGERDFPNWVEGTWTLWIMITTANYPDVMMPSYNQTPISGIYGVSFMVLSFYLLMNLVLATVVEHYQLTIKDQKEREGKLVQENLAAAFQLMDPLFEFHNPEKQGNLDKTTIIKLVRVLNEDFPELRYLDGEETEALFGILDKDDSSVINFEEFQEFGRALLSLTKRPDYSTFVQTNMKALYNSISFQRLIKAVHSHNLDRFINLTLVLNAILVVIESYPQLAGQEDSGIDQDDSRWSYVELVFTTIYIFEVIIKVAVDGWKKYIEQTQNVFDFVITVAALFATGYVYYPNTYDDNGLITSVIMIRVLRLGRILMKIPTFRKIGTVSAQILPNSASIIQLLFFIMYLFAAIGTLLYGGLITRDPNNPLSTVLLDTEFAESDYWGNNFNDMMSGMNVLFNLLIINNWTVCESGFEATTGGKYVRFFFLSFHLVGVIIVNNLFISFIINNFYEQLQKEDESKSDEATGVDDDGSLDTKDA